MTKRKRHVKSEVRSHYDESRYIWYHSSIPSQSIRHSEIMVLSDVVDSYLMGLLYTVKDLFSLLPENVFLHIRGKTNCYESLGKGPRKCFINRSAMKMVNLDSFLSLNQTDSANFFTFVDLCGGPGGFIEFFSRRSQSNGSAKVIGFGMTLKHELSHRDASCNWKLDHLHNPPHVSVITHNPDEKEPPFVTVETDARCNIYIINGKDGTGNLYSKENSASLVDFVNSIIQKKTDANGESRITFPGVNVVTGDGGFSEASDQNNQELLSFPLLLCQVIAMIGTLNTGGTYIQKVFACHEVPTVRLFLLLTDLFDSIALVKPVTSRPANSEKYLLCRGFRLTEKSTRCDLQEHLWRWFEDHNAAAASTTLIQDRSTVAVISTESNPATYATGAPIGNNYELSRFEAALEYLRITNDRQAVSQLQACVRILEVCISCYKKQISKTDYETIETALSAPVPSHLMHLVTSSKSSVTDALQAETKTTYTLRDILVDELEEPVNAWDYYKAWRLFEIFEE